MLLHTASSSRVSNPEERDGMIMNTINSRKIMPTFNTKNNLKYNY